MGWAPRRAHCPNGRLSTASTAPRREQLPPPPRPSVAGPAAAVTMPLPHHPEELRLAGLPWGAPEQGAEETVGDLRQ